MPADFYELLDVGPDASAEDIRRAYREKAREYHPDVNPDARSNDQFKAIRTAYEVLSDASERTDYDRMGHRTYVDARLDGLPGSKGVRPAGRRNHQSGAASRQSGTTSGSAGTAARSSGRARSTAREAGGSSNHRSTWGERTISEPGARARAMRAGERIGVGPFLVMAGIGYLAGLATFLAGRAGALAAITRSVLGGNVDVLLAVLLARGFADPLPFVTRAVEHLSPGLLLPVGVVAFPLVLAVHAFRTSRAVWWLWSGLSLGPLAGLGLAANAVPATVAVDLASYVLLPAMAILGSIVTFVRE